MADSKIKDLTEKVTGAATDEFVINDVAGGNLDRKMGMDGLRITQSQVTDLEKTSVQTVAATDSSAKAKAMADFTCDGTNDEVEINAAVAALPSTGGMVRLLEGNYVAEGITANEAVDFRGDGMFATKISLPTGASTPLFSAPSQANFTGGGIFDMELNGEDATAPQHGVDMSGVSTTLAVYHIKGCYLHGFDHAYNGPAGTERFVPIESNRIWQNAVGINATEHPAPVNNDIRSNSEAAVAGTMFDAILTANKFNGNLVGITSDTGNGVGSLLINGCAFAGNTNFDIDLNSDNTIIGTSFIVPTTGATGSGIKIKGSLNHIVGNKFEPQGDTFGWTNGCIEFIRPDGATTSQTSEANQIAGNIFYNPSGPVIDIETPGGAGAKIVKSTQFRSNTMRLTNRGVIFSTQGSLRQFSFCENDIFVDGNVEDGAAAAAAVWDYDSTSTSTSIKFDNNHITKDTGSVAAILFGDFLNDSSIMGNTFVGFTEDVIQAGSTTSAALIANNVGYDVEQRTAYTTDASGNITPTGTVDGRDIATDGTKLDTIATSANNYSHPNHTGDVTSTGDGATVISAGAVDIAMLSATGTPDGTTFLRGDNTWAAPAGSGDMVLASAQTNTGIKTFLDTTMKLRNVANTADGYFVNTNTADRIYTLQDSSDTLVGRATTDTLTNKTFDANGTGNSLSNVDVADLANGTDGELITWDATGAPATVAVGTAGHVLTSNGVGAAPTFQAAGAASLPVVDTTSIAEGSVDPTKEVRFEVDGNTTGIVGVLATAFTTAKTVTFPDATDTLMGKATTDVMTNKTFDANGIGNSLSNVDNADLTGGVYAAITGLGAQSQELDLNTNNIDDIGTAFFNTARTASIAGTADMTFEIPAAGTYNWNVATDGKMTLGEHLVSADRKLHVLGENSVRLTLEKTNATNRVADIIIDEGSLDIVSPLVTEFSIGGAGSPVVTISSGTVDLEGNTLTNLLDITSITNLNGVAIGNYALATGDNYTGAHTFNGATMRIPLSATPTMAVDGDFAIDTTVTDLSHGLMKYYDGEELGVVAMPIAQYTTPTDGHVVAYNATNDEFELVAGGGSSSPLTTKGDIWVYTTADARLPIGATTGHVLTVDPAEASGMKWAAAGAASQTPWASDIDADGFDLNDLSNIEFRNTTGAPAASTPAIYATASGMIFNIPSGDLYTWNRNAMTQLAMDSAGNMEFQGNNLEDIGVAYITERAAAALDVTTAGQIWVKNTDPNELWYTDGDGTDNQVAFTQDIEVAVPLVQEVPEGTVGFPDVHDLATASAHVTGMVLPDVTASTINLKTMHPIPDGLAATPGARIEFVLMTKTAETSANVRLTVHSLAVADAENFDQVFAAETETSVSMPAAAETQDVYSQDMTTDPVAGDTVLVKLARDPTDGADTYAGDIQIVSATLWIKRSR